MTPTEISEIAAQSAKIYYDYVEAKKGAVAVIRINKIEQTASHHIFTLSKDLFYKDEFDISICNTIIDKNAYSVIKYDDDERKLYILFEKEINSYTLGQPLTVDNIHLESSLLFLISNVKNWYEKNSPKLPKVHPDFRFYNSSEKFAPSPEQKSAIYNIHQSPLSYVWGAPGTGKTQFVLARCIVDYIRTFNGNINKKIIISAPTNNALEQILFGVFKVFEEESISTDTVIRLGIPSKKFASEYPNSCELVSVETKIEKISQELKDLKNVLTKRHEINIIKQISDKFISSLEEIQQLDDDRNTINAKIEKLKIEIDQLELSLAKVRINLFDFKKEFSELKKESHKFFYHISKKKKAELQYNIDKKILAINELEDVASANSKILEKAQSECEHFTNELFEIKSNESVKCELFADLKEYRTFKSDAVKSLLNDLIQYADLDIKSFCDLGIKSSERSIESVQEKIDLLKYSDYDNKKIADFISDFQSEYDKLLANSMKSKIANCNVIALTVDKFISKYDDFLELKDSIKHVFIDEAAYLSIIKGLTLFSMDAPITLLGDHMQLPPICEATKEFIKRNPIISLWEIPVIYCEELFKNNINSFLCNFDNSHSPCFVSLSKSTLNSTYRFGNNLASVLANVVYSPEFHSATTNATKITVINAVKIPTKNKRVSPLEVIAACEYVDQYLEGEKSFAILTPYRNQHDELLKHLSSDVNCLTIHSSQGQEWNVVIISTVDTFMASDIKIINTAISRAKKDLIIICDVNHWKLFPDRLITQIISIADSNINLNGKKLSAPQSASSAQNYK